MKRELVKIARLCIVFHAVACILAGIFKELPYDGTISLRNIVGSLLLNVLLLIMYLSLIYENKERMIICIAGFQLLFLGMYSFSPLYIFICITPLLVAVFWESKIYVWRMYMLAVTSALTYVLFQAVIIRNNLWKELFFVVAGLGLISQLLSLLLNSLGQKDRQTQFILDQSCRDSMTDLYNRGAMEKVLENEINIISPASIIMLDIDHFKNINDTYGHAVGDEVIKALAKTIKRNCKRKEDCAFRYGGEEFVVFLPMTSKKEAFMVAERMREEFSSLDFTMWGIPNAVTISLGVAEKGVKYKSYMEFVKQADKALYYSKEHGRNQTTMFSGDLMENEKTS